MCLKIFKIRGLILLLLVLFVMDSCTTIKKNQNLNNHSYFEYCNGLIAYRLLYDFDYNPKIDRKTFWANAKYNGDLAINRMHIPYDYLLDEINKLPEGNTLDEYDYAFVNNCKDTIYSNYCLDNWEVRSNGKSKYYIFPDSLKTKENYSDLKGIIKSNNFLEKQECMDAFYSIKH